MCFALSCKKDSASSPIPTQEPVIVSIDGVIEMHRQFGPFSTNYTNASFNSYAKSDVGTDFGGSFAGTTAGTFSMNAIQFKNEKKYYDYWDSTNYFFNYIDTTHCSYTPPYQFIVSGSDSVPAFSYTSNLNYPVFSDTAQLPNYINRNSDLKISLHGAQNTKIISFSVLSYPCITGCFPTSTGLILHTEIQGKFILIKKEELKKLASSSRAFISIQFINNEYFNVGSKKYKFIQTLRLSKQITVD